MSNYKYLQLNDEITMPAWHLLQLLEIFLSFSVVLNLLYPLNLHLPYPLQNLHYYLNHRLKNKNKINFVVIYYLHKFQILQFVVLIYGYLSFQIKSILYLVFK